MDGNDYYTLLQIVEAEATGGDIKSKILIANVVLNRVKDSRFPDTIYDVVWQTAGGSPQFSPTDDGRIYTVSITDDTIEAVDRALAGEDYSQGALRKPRIWSGLTRIWCRCLNMADTNFSVLRMNDPLHEKKPGAW